MLSRELRLTAERDILKTRKGRSFKGSFFILNAVMNRLGNPRIVIVVNKKVSLKSTKRNLLKRRTSEILKNYINSVSHVDLSINILPTAMEASFVELQKDLAAGLNHIGILKK